jgi:protein involved in polysaccharide export with SLBB domain
MKVFRLNMFRSLSTLGSLIMVFTMTGCALFKSTDNEKAPPQRDVTQDPFQIGDRIKVELTGTPDMFQPQEQDIHPDGSIQLPFINRVMAAGVSPSKLEEDIHALYVPRYFTHITVTITPMARFFFVGGQVNNNAGGRILYTGPITVMGAIQAAGDFTPFANKRHVQITRADGTIEHVNCNDAINHPKRDLPVYPNDRILVPRRSW